MTLYPFNADMVQLNMARCPAPWCGRPYDHAPPWFTLCQMPGVLRPIGARLGDCCAAPRGVRLATCHREACRRWAELRAHDIGKETDLYSTREWRVSRYYEGIDRESLGLDP